MEGVLCAVAVSAALFAQAQPLGLTPDRIREAIASGTNAKDLGQYQLRQGRIQCSFSTPYRRVEIVAREAKKNYRQISEADLTADIVAPTAEISCYPVYDGGRYAESVRNFVITGKGGSAPDDCGVPIKLDKVK
jgi:hypothetical protein